MAKYKEMSTKCEALTEKQNMQEKELLTKTEKVSYTEARSLILTNITLVFINITLLFFNHFLDSEFRDDVKCNKAKRDKSH